MIGVWLVWLIGALLLTGCAEAPTASPANGLQVGPTPATTTTPGATASTGSGIQPNAIAGGQPLPTPTAPGPDNRRVLTIWTANWKGNADYEKFLNDIIDNYRARNRTLTVDWQDWGNDLAAKFQEAAANPTKNALPDIVLFDERDLYEFGAAGYLTDLTALGGSNLKDDYSTAAFEGLRYGSVYYGLPWVASLPVTLINKKLWQQATLDPAKPPRTYAELDQILPLMASKTPTSVTPCWVKPDPLADFMTEDAPVFNVSGDGKVRQPAFPSPATTAKWQYYKDKLFKQNGVFDKDALTKQPADALKKYQAGNLIMIMDGAGLLPALKNASADLYNNTIVAPALVGKAGLVPLNIQGWAITKGSRQAAESLTFLKYLNSPENQLAFAKLSGQTIPTLKKALTDSYVRGQDDPIAQARAVMADSLEKSRPPDQLMPAPLDPVRRDKLTAALNNAQAAIWNNRDTSPQAALTEAAKTWTDVLK